MCPQIKSLLLRNSIPSVYQHLYAITLARYRQPPQAECRPLPGATAWYRDIRANMEQAPKPEGLDHYGKMTTTRLDEGSGHAENRGGARARNRDKPGT